MGIDGGRLAQTEDEQRAHLHSLSHEKCIILSPVASQCRESGEERERGLLYRQQSGEGVTGDRIKVHYWLSVRKSAASSSDTITPLYGNLSSLTLPIGGDP